jgi:hypothetical protein
MNGNVTGARTIIHSVVIPTMNNDQNNSVDNVHTDQALLKYLIMVTDRLDAIENQIENQHKEQLRHQYSYRESVCEGSIFNVHCPVVHIGSRIKVKDQHNFTEERRLCHIDFIGIANEVHIVCELVAMDYEDEEEYDPETFEPYQMLKDNAGEIDIWSYEKRNYNMETDYCWDFVFTEDQNNILSTSYNYIQHVKKIFDEAGLLNFFQEHVKVIVVWTGMEGQFIEEMMHI